METLIPTINKLQEVFSTVGAKWIQLPQIAVVGTQSSGKSSVLEAIVGRSFLPRGVGIVTRCPLILELTHCPVGDTQHRSKEQDTLNVEEFAQFNHTGSEIFTDFDEIRQEIEKETNNIAGTKKCISQKPIVLKLFSPNVVSLTLVDLPGLTKVPLDDQPEDIEQQIRDLILQYITNPNCIILAVITANTDMATNESLKLAKECDPEGHRTLGVLTKLDLMDAGTDATDILCGNVIPVKLGIIGVVNRSQKDIQDGKSISKSLMDETKFFQTKYPALAHKNGTSYLAKTLSTLLMHHIRDCLPDLKTRVNSRLLELEKLLSVLGKEVTDKNQTLLQMITGFAYDYCAMVDGAMKSVETEELSTGARICYIYHEIFVNMLHDISPLIGLNKYEILTALRNAAGLKPAMFVPEVAFEWLAKKQITLLLKPALCCVNLVHDEMRRAVRHCDIEVRHGLARFPKLQQKIFEIVTQQLNQRLLITKQVVENLINMQLAYINTSHPDFQEEGNLLKEKAKEMQCHRNKNECYIFAPAADVSLKHQKSRESANHLTETLIPINRELSEKEKEDCMVLEYLVKQYFCIVSKSIQDYVPKAVTCHLVNYMKENILSELISRLYTSNNIDELLLEDVHTTKRREESFEMLECLQNAISIVNEVHESHMW